MLRKYGAWWSLVWAAVFSQGVSAGPLETVMLFSGDHKSMEWMLTDHGGASGIRGGKACESCHIAGFRLPKKRISLDVSVDSATDGVAMTFLWPGPATATLGVMMDGGGAGAFQRAGCWVACHDDIRGMSPDADQTKYLGQTRSKMTRNGGGSALKPAADIADMRAASNLIEFLKVELKADSPPVLSRGSILEQEHLAVVEDAQVSATREGKNWRVSLTLAPASDETAVGFAVLQTADGADDASHYMSLGGVLKTGKSGPTLEF